ncbi:vacuolar ATPase assembly protein VMA22 isoform X2 [Epinephelus lanceolatus]|uniref:coiled-coil domain-containing protein 115 isoform X2 n=1 Tax=Epinephelus lanceolatus TaxID=310571 RepID=UPI001447ADB9|nr:coiled-coil domain-containing protein 115 isoform X2 [Epinephelus lanceolatus]XP_049922065.1 coiled-coil domain-containing protein 115 isoform X2 [Epinephelus moara]
MGVSQLEESSLLLDEKLLRFMDQLELLEEKRAALNSLIEQGWFSISKARYSMGNKHVSALQYASEIEPLVCVHARTLDSGEVDFCSERVKQKCSNEAGKDAKSIEDIGPQEEGVRRRIKPKKDTTEKEASEEASSEKAPEVTPVRKIEQNPQQDPLKWFGILVPQSLKQAQSSFRQVIELSAEIATLQTAVLNTRRELQHSMKNKHSLQEEALAAQLDQVAD